MYYKEFTLFYCNSTILWAVIFFIIATVILLSFHLLEYNFS